MIKQPKLSLIAAVAENGVIGRGLDLPWRLKSDLQHFKAITLGKPIIMGSTTWDSLPKKPLPGRMNIVLSRDLKFEAPGALICGSLFEAMELAREHALDEGIEDICVIGGANIYAQTIEKADRLYISHIHADIDGDVYFPDFDKTQWSETNRQFQAKGDGDDYDFTTLIYERITASR